VPSVDYRAGQQPGQAASDGRRGVGPLERADRNMVEMLQELRVAQTGIQILFAFLLSIAFQQRFSRLSAIQRDIYLATLVCAALAAAFFIAPVAVHRIMFRLNLKDEIVRYTGKMAVLGLVFLVLAMVGSVLLIVDVVAGAVPAVLIAMGLAVVFAVAWVVLPATLRRRLRDQGATADQSTVISP
jgi:hypothetical protein